MYAYAPEYESPTTRPRVVLIPGIMGSTLQDPSMPTGTCHELVGSGLSALGVRSYVEIAALRGGGTVVSREALRLPDCETPYHGWYVTSTLPACVHQLLRADACLRVGHQSRQHVTVANVVHGASRVSAATSTPPSGPSRNR